MTIHLKKESENICIFYFLKILCENLIQDENIKFIDGLILIFKV